jgi:hypothetical protein
MKVRTIMLIAVAGTITLTSVAAARPGATRQRVQIDLKVFRGNSFVLAPLEAGPLERDSGKQRCLQEPLKQEVSHDGQTAWLWDCRAWKFVGKRGTLVLRSRFTWIEAGGPYNIATGTWKVVRGTGQYARVTGHGRSAQVGSNAMWKARYQGFVTKS